MRKTLFVVGACLLTAIVFASGTAAADTPELIANGDFESGNALFGSDYAYMPGVHALTPPQTYSVVSDPSHSHIYFSSFGDHTSGSGNMLVANAAVAAGQRVWHQSVSVHSNTAYAFSGWVASVIAEAPATLEVRINDVSIGVFGAPASTGIWEEFSAAWGSGSSDTAHIEIIDLTCSNSGDDFALDDLSLEAVTFEVEVDIKPGSWPNAINANGRGVIPVAILTTPEFDATTLDASSLRLEGAMPTNRGKPVGLCDVNGDGDLDLLVRFVDDTSLAGKTSATVRGMVANSANPVAGVDWVKPVP